VAAVHGEVVSDVTAPDRVAGHLLRLLDLEPEDLPSLLGSVDELRDGWFRPLGRLIGSNVALAERHIRCGVRDAANLLGCLLVDGSWDELASRCTRAELTAPASEPAVLIGVDPDHARLERVAEHSPVPVINAGSNRHQPLQVLADLVTLRDFLGPLRGRHLLLVEDDLALRRSWAEACVLAGMRCTVAEVTTAGMLGPEFADAVAHADLIGGEVLPISEWGVSLDDVDVVIGTGRRPHRWMSDVELLRTSEADTIVIPGRLDAEVAAPGHAGSESARAVLYHRSRNITTVAAALIRRAVISATARAEGSSWSHSR
jgi:ornithine carbamoyltransferase